MIFKHTFKQIIFSIFFIFIFNSDLIAGTLQDVNEIVSRSEKPVGVVFEILEGKEKDIRWTMNLVNQASQTLKKRFPDIKIAVVSHGGELFAFSKTNKKDFKKIHSLAEQMNNNDIPVHVCGTHASWRQKSEKDFPSYITVVEAAPAQIAFYEDLGYQLVIVEK